MFATYLEESINFILTKGLSFFARQHLNKRYLLEVVMHLLSATEKKAAPPHERFL
jgi:hypothetical protein